MTTSRRWPSAPASSRTAAARRRARRARRDPGGGRRVNRRFARIEQIKRFAVLDRDLSHADGELTPTLKVKRATVEAHFGALIDRLYA